MGGKEEEDLPIPKSPLPRHRPPVVVDLPLLPPFALTDLLLHSRNEGGKWIRVMGSRPEVVCAPDLPSPLIIMISRTIGQRQTSQARTGTKRRREKKPIPGVKRGGGGKEGGHEVYSVYSSLAPRPDSIS